ncbi:DMT family transporter [Variovorax sp. J31P179]|uniref:DMT family transporter n=1 Tax=Variovorax sp. J31P179 TaxID=3053508 RepID=UPI002577BE8D|nr:DMT family transporter [Variovorax sp. J31P179]MDM0085400.1 DMT family transporter [Variovorax sp. J31P179]
MKTLKAIDGPARQTLAVQATLIGAMAVWGLNVTAVKLLTQSFDSALLAAVRMVVAVAVLTVILFWKHRAFAALTMKQVCALLLCGALMVYMNQLLFSEGLLRSTATNGALIMALSPLVSALLAALLFRDKLTPKRMAGVALGLGGVAAVVLSHPGAGLSRASTGDFMLVAAVISFASGGALVQRLARRLDPLVISWAVHLVGTGMLLAQVVGRDNALDMAALFPGWWQWALILFSGVFATAIASIVWNRAIATIGVARTAVFLYWVPVFGVLFAAMLLGERLTLWHLAGFIAVVAGTYLGTGRQA